MADYNVQMKQFNGTSFDNILPHASEALTLAGGGGATEIIAQARAGLSQIAIGSYVGTGTYGQSHPTVINCGFRPKMVLWYQKCMYVSSTMATSGTIYGAFFAMWADGVVSTYVGNSSAAGMGKMIFSQTDTGLSFYTDFTSQYVNAAQFQNNDYNKTYLWLAIG